jgi:hypothetical protein
MIFVSCKEEEEEKKQEEEVIKLTPNPSNPNNLIAYFAFDATPVGQAKLPITTFTDKANEIVMFEGTVWEMADTVHYGNPTSYILSRPDAPYRYYKQIIDDMKTMQARGVKILWNVDDNDQWLESSPFTTYNGRRLTAAQFAAFVDSCVNVLGLDGIALDIEHLTDDVNINWINVVKGLGKYFGPKSPRPKHTLYVAAIYSGAKAGDDIGKSVEMAEYFNFVMDMGYFNTDNIARFQQYASVIGNGKVMTGMSHQYNSQANAVEYAAWEPIGDKKAGVMVFAANVNKAYTDAIFSANK